MSSGFNPVLGFLSVSTDTGMAGQAAEAFQSRAGFSECLDNIKILRGYLEDQFQSRAGFSECLD